MKFYRVSWYCEGGNSAGFSWHTSKREAEKEVRANTTDDPSRADPYTIADETAIHLFEINATKAGILRALRAYASYADNG